MNARRALPLLALLLAAGIAAALAEAAAGDGSVVELDAILPPYETKEEDEYLCTAVQLPDRPMKLISVESLSEQATVHHMLLFGCQEPAEHKPVWGCRMSAACGAGGEHVMYGWGKNAPPVHLPNGTGFSVGPGTGTRSVVLQVHYLKLRPPGDSSGVRLRLTSAPVPYSAGLVAYASGFSVPPRKNSTLVPNECCYSGFEPLHGFAFRVHTHALGRRVFLDHTPAAAGRGRGKGKAVRALEQDPQLPQGFYPADPVVTIHPGDKLQATCDFNSAHMAHAVHAGHTAQDEMCNLYLMLYGELPFFMWCVDGGEWVQADGAGGVPAKAELLPEQSVWAPPDRIPAPPAPAMHESAEGPPPAAPAGQVAGVVDGGDGTLWAVFRGSRTWTANTFDPDTHLINKADPIGSPVVAQLARDTGAVLRSWGAGQFYLPHMISVDPEGNLWVVDTGLHQALKFSPEGEQLLALGQRLSPGLDESSLCMPTHAIAARDGTIFVGDGYCNSRVVQYSADGRYQREFVLPAEPGAPAPLPHSLALDECKRRLYVADREIGRLVAFDLDSGDLVAELDLQKDHGLPYALQVGPYGTLMVLTWQRDTTGAAKIVAVADGLQNVVGAWVAAGAQAPHDLALTPAPLAVTGAGERLLSVLVAETAPSGSRLRKYVLRGAHHTHTGAAGAGAEQQQDEEEELPAGLAASHAGHGTTLKPAGGGGAKAKRAEQAAPRQQQPPEQQQQQQKEEEEEVLDDEEEASSATPDSELPVPEETAEQEAAHAEQHASPAPATHTSPQKAQQQEDERQHPMPATQDEEQELKQQDSEEQEDPIKDLAARLEDAQSEGEGAAAVGGGYAGSSFLGIVIGLGALAVVGFVFSRAMTWRGTTGRGYRRADRAV